MSDELAIRAGDLRQRAKIQGASTTRDSVGGTTQAWSDLVTVWADISPLTGKEIQQAAKLQAEVDTEIRIRHRAGIDSTMRVLQIDTGEIYDIRSVRDVRARLRVLVLGCRKRT